MPPVVRIRWDFYLNRFGTPYNRTERMAAMNSFMVAQNKNAKIEDFMLSVHEQVEEQNDYEKGQIMLAQMASQNGGKK